MIFTLKTIGLLLLFLFTGGFLSTCLGQTNAIFENINQANGLSGNQTTNVAIEKNGFIWIGTKNGLNRYDGLEFKVYNKQNSNLLSSDISKVFIDSQNNMWIGTIGGGLAIYLPEVDRFKVYRSSKKDSLSIASNQINTIFEDTKKQLWIGTGEGLSRYQREEDNFTNLHASGGAEKTKANQSVSSIYEDVSGNLWVGTFGSGLYKYDTSNGVFTPFESGFGIFSRFIHVIEYLDGNNLLLGTSGGGLLRFDMNTLTFSDFFKEISVTDFEIKIVRTITYDNFRNLWVGTDGNGLFKIENLATKRPVLIENFKKNSQFSNTISGDAIYDIVIDEMDRLWISTAWNGINTLDTKNPVRFFASDFLGINSIPILSIFEEGDELFFGLDGGGLTVYDKFEKKTITIEESTQNFGNSYVQCIGKDKDGILWIGTFSEGILQYDPGKRRLLRYSHIPNITSSLSHDNVRDFVMNDDFTMWVATWGGGLNLLDIKKGEFSQYMVETDNPKSISSDDVTGLVKDPKGLWISTFGGGLNHFIKSENSFVRYQSSENNKNSISSNNLLCLFKDSRNHIWVGTSGEGINRLNTTTNKIDRFENDDLVKYKTVTAITEDNQGTIWFSTKDGIFSYDNTNRFRGYPELKGEYHINAVFKNTSGNLYFGRTDGAIQFDPKKVMREVKSHPKTRLLGLKVFNEKILPGEGEIITKSILFETNVVLQYEQDVITFDFAALHYPSSINCEYAVQMGNFEESWRFIGNTRSATYTNLSPGTYEFKVKSKLKGFDWTDDYTSIEVQILKPFWQSSWAIITYVLLFFVLLFLFWKYTSAWERMKNNLQLERVAKQKDAELYESKQKFFTNISHEIRTPVTLILGAFEKLVSEVNIPKSEIDLKGIIEKNSERLLNLVNELLDDSQLELTVRDLKVTKNDFVAFCNEVFLSFTVTAEERDIRFNFKTDQTESTIWFDKNQIEKVLYNLLSNAFKFTKAGGMITLRLWHTDESAFFSVVDSGVGMYEKQLGKIFNRFHQIKENQFSKATGYGLGLSISKEIMVRHRGTLAVESSKGKGSTFTVSLLRRTNHFTSEQLVKGPEFKVNTTLQLASYGSTSLENKHTSIQNTLKNHTVLLVEDNADILMYLNSLISSFCEVKLARNGEEGLKVALELIPDIIISDIMMPVMNGIDMTQILKTDVKTSHIPIILLTARASAKHKIQGYGIGADDYVTKPFHKELLLARIQNLLVNRKLLHERAAMGSFAIPKDIAANQTDQKFMERFIDIVQNHIDDENLNAEFIATSLGMSHSVVYKKVKAITGMSIVEYVRDYKLIVAKKLIEFHHLTVAEASYHIGYADKKYFSRLFKAKFGKIPSAYYPS